MGAKRAARGALIVALVTGKRFRAHVLQLMSAKMAAVGAAIVALVAGKRLLARVRPLMGTKRTGIFTAIVTMVAGKTSFRCIHYLGALGGCIRQGGQGNAHRTLCSKLRSPEIDSSGRKPAFPVWGRQRRRRRTTGQRNQMRYCYRSERRSCIVQRSRKHSRSLSCRRFLRRLGWPRHPRQGIKCHREWGHVNRGGRSGREAATPTHQRVGHGGSRGRYGSHGELQHKFI